MYRKYLQELSDRPSSSSQPRASPDTTVFPDTHLIVGDAHLKAARAGAAHREQLGTNRVDSVAVSLSSAGKSDCCHVNQSSACKSNSQHVAVSHSSKVTSESHSAGVVHTGGATPGAPNTTLVQSPKVKSASDDSGVIPSPSVQNDSHTSSPSHSQVVRSSGRGSAVSESSVVSSRGCGSAVSDSPVVKSRGRGSAVSHSSGAVGENRGKRDPRRYAETIQLEDFMSRTNTPEFRRRPIDLLVTDVDDAVDARPGVSARGVHSPHAGRPSPIQVWDSQSFSDVSQEEVIVSRPVVEATKNRAPLYPAPRGNLISSVVVEKTRYTHAHSPDVIKVLSISQDSQGSEGLGVEDPRARRENGLSRPSSKFTNNLREEMAPWGRRSQSHKPSPQKVGTVKEPTTVGCYSVFCCSVRPGSSNSRR